MISTLSGCFAISLTLLTLASALQNGPMNLGAIHRYARPHVQLASGMQWVGMMPRKMTPFPQLATRVAVPKVAAAVQAVHVPRPMINVGGVHLATVRMAYMASAERRRRITKAANGIVKELRAVNTVQNMARPKMAIRVAPGKVQFATQDPMMDPNMLDMLNKFKEMIDKFRAMMQSEDMSNPGPIIMSPAQRQMVATVLGDAVQLVPETLTFDWLTEEVIEFIEEIFEFIIEILEAILEYKEEKKGSIIK